MSPNASARLRLHLKPAAEMAVRRGHPWLQVSGIEAQNRPGTAGELAALYGRRDRLIGLGLFDPYSPLRVRVLHVGGPVRIDREWWRRRLEAALARRTGLFDRLTTGWRCIHGESDGWPGLVLDRYDRTCVLKLYTAAWKPWLPELTAVIRQALEPESIVLRLSRNISPDATDPDSFADGIVIAGEPVTGPIQFLENGLTFEANVLHGQKTGFFLDQRENRARVGSMAGGRRVLNCFSFSGGFSLYAARGGATEVTDIDISPHAIAATKRHFTLNRHLPGVDAVRHLTFQADVFQWLQSGSWRDYEFVVLDPPAFAKRRSERPAAMAAYRRLAQLGSARLRSGGILLACSCSAQVSADDFFAAVLEGVRRAGKSAIQLLTAGHPPDHPATFPEAAYLKAIYLRLLDNGVKSVSLTNRRTLPRRRR